jgi:hypothetical protein
MDQVKSGRAGLGKGMAQRDKKAARMDLLAGKGQVKQIILEP